MAEVVHFGYEGGPSRRTYLVPLDRAPADLPRAKFRPCRIGRFSADELADIINPAALERHRRAQFDLEKFCQFGWLVVEEEVQLEQAARRDWLTRFLDTTFEPFGSVDVHSRRFPEIIERALVTLLLHPWEEFISFSGQSWEPFAVPWIYVVDSDPFEAPRRVPDPTSLSWKPDETPDGHLIERASPVTSEFDRTVFDNFEARLHRN